MSRPKIYVNGDLAGEWKYGYGSFRVDITPFLKFGQKNTIAVRVDNPPNSSRWYPGGGIHRPCVAHGIQPRAHRTLGRLRQNPGNH